MMQKSHPIESSDESHPIESSELLTIFTKYVENAQELASCTKIIFDVYTDYVSFNKRSHIVQTHYLLNLSQLSNAFDHQDTLLRQALNHINSNMPTQTIDSSDED